jgi:hydroxymethylbilane synthase
VLAAVPAREETADALVLPADAADIGDLAALPGGARLGTGSLRRRAQLWHVRRDLQMADVRGNVETRIHKLDAGAYEGLVLAKAGLKRLDLACRISLELSPPLMYPAVGQGALGIECREDDADTIALLARIDDRSGHRCVAAERSLLAQLRAGCHAPVGAATTIAGEELLLEAVVLNAAGTERLFASGRATADAAALGREVADRLLQQGAGRLIAGT